MSTREYIDAGDRVIVTGNAHFHGSSDLSAHQGKHGVVTSNDGWGQCGVTLDDGTRVTTWNAADLTREESDEPSEAALTRSAPYVPDSRQENDRTL